MTEGENGPWSFLDKVDAELREIDNRIQEICLTPRKVDPPVHMPTPPLTAPARRSRTLRGSLPAMSPRVAMMDPSWERQSEYKMLPSRGNASARIYKPAKLGVPLYQSRRRVVPVILGRTIPVAQPPGECSQNL